MTVGVTVSVNGYRNLCARIAWFRRGIREGGGGLGVGIARSWVGTRVVGTRGWMLGWWWWDGGMAWVWVWMGIVCYLVRGRNKLINTNTH